jgi:hypothetical protein
VDNTLSWFIAVGIAVLLVVQALVFVGLYLLARRLVEIAERANERAKKLQDQVEYTLNNTEPVLKMAHNLMSELKEAADYFNQGVQHISAITEMAKDEAAEVKSLLGDTTALARREIERGRDHVDRIQRTLAGATDQFERTTALVQTSVLQPAREFSYLMYGLRRSIEVLTTGKRLPVNRAYQDEEMFI